MSQITNGSAALATGRAVSAHQHPSFDTRERQLIVTGVTALTPTITNFVFADPLGRMLTSYQPGSHLIIQAGATRNTYSLIGDGVNPRTYAISVLRRGGAGGSDWLHDNIYPGMSVTIEGPRSLFAPHTIETNSLLVAGGIGVTPILSHARAASRWGKTAEVVYTYRPGFGAHLHDLRSLAETGAITLYEAQNQRAAAELLKQRFADQPMGTHAYACGPISMLDTYLMLGTEAGWPKDRLHLERFEVAAQDPGAPFNATIASTGQRIAIPAGVSLLERLLESGVPVSSLCRQGVCGECRIPIRSGAIEHRDYVLSDT